MFETLDPKINVIGRRSVLIERFLKPWVIENFTSIKDISARWDSL